MTSGTRPGPTPIIPLASQANVIENHLLMSVYPLGCALLFLFEADAWEEIWLTPNKLKITSCNP